MATADKRPLKVFLCHASGDKANVRDLYKRLTVDGVDAWLDQEKLLPGQDWRMEIPRAVREADVVVICLSKNSITKEGYVQKEIKFALDIAEEKPEGTIFLIPARLEDCDVPERLSRWQWVDLYEGDGLVKLLRSLKLRADAVGATVEPTSYVDAEKELQHKLEQLYTEGLAAFYTEDWDKACQRFQSILSERPNHKNATDKLEEAERQRNLAKLYEQAIAAIRSDNWESAIRTLEELTQCSVDYKDTAQLLKNACKQKQLRGLYAEAKALYVGKQWEAVVKVFEQISSIEPNYPDTDGLLPSAQKEVAELRRFAELNEQYSRALREMDAGNWDEARRLLELVHKSQPRFLETEKLLKKVENEILREEEKHKQNDQVNTLYEQAHGLLRSKKWRNALDKLAEIKNMDADFADTDNIEEKANKELAQEEQETERQNQLAALYAEAVKLLKDEKYQEALNQWQEVKTVDPKYPDRQRVERTARKKITQKNYQGKTIRIYLPKSQKKYLLPGISIGLVLLGIVGLIIYVNQPYKLPQCVQSTHIGKSLSIKSSLSSSPVFIDGQSTYPAEWTDSQCYQVDLAEWKLGQGCEEGDSIPSFWFLKNNGQNLYILVKIPKTSLYPKSVNFSYFYPYPYTNGWQHSDEMVFMEDGPADHYGWDESTWYDDTSDGGSMDTRAKRTETELYYWYEFSKPLDSGDDHDLSWEPGEKVGTDITGNLMIGTWGDLPSGGGSVYVCQLIQIQLSK